VDLRYGAPVVMENPDAARLVAARLLDRLSAPWEVVDLETWLEGVRLEIGDTVALTSPFHGYRQEEFTVFGKSVDLKRRRVRVNAARPFTLTWALAVDAAGSGNDAYAIDEPSSLDPNWPSRAYAG